MGDMFGGLKIRISEDVPRGEIWLATNIGYEKRETWGGAVLTITISERLRVDGKVLFSGPTREDGQ